jgi:hypothetical protein
MRGRYFDKNDNVFKYFDLRELVKNAGKLDSSADLKDLSATEAGESSTLGLIALQNALKLESVVTKSIRNLIKVCESEDKVYKFGKNSEE